MSFSLLPARLENVQSLKVDDSASNEGASLKSRRPDDAEPEVGRRARGHRFQPYGRGELRRQQGSVSGARHAPIVDAFVAGQPDELAVLKMTGSLIRRCGGDLPAADAGMRELRRAVCPHTGRFVVRDVHMFTAVISAHAKVGDVEGARSWFLHMLSRRVSPNVVTYNALISAYEKAGDAQGATEWFEYLLKQGIRPDLETCTAMIAVFERTHRWKEAADQLNDALARGILRPSLGYDDRRNSLDLHRSAVATGEASSRSGINPCLARNIFRALLAQGRLDERTVFIVGRHGDDRLRQAMRACMEAAGWTPRHPLDRHGRINEGAWVAM
ncbi:pentatricopeptide repeat-containing protein [Mitsuaria sp. CC2]|uniref:pentatricopeptide repeat-containing protein n=1 Tax=Mitsuaria sp. CC2 TaxID=3029186 RepID=UPI003B8C77E2